MKAVEKPIDFDERKFSQRAHQIYNRIKSDLEQKYKGKILAVEPDSGDYFFGESKMEAAMQAKVKDVRLNKLTISEFKIIASNDNLKLNWVSKLSHVLNILINSSIFLASDLKQCIKGKLKWMSIQRLQLVKVYVPFSTERCQRSYYYGC